jgi:hypothetical protein
MPGNLREMITAAERRFPVRIRIAVPPNGLGQRYTQITAWLDENCRADRWAMTPSGTRGPLNDAVSIYFADATLASAFAPAGASGLRSRRLGVCSKSETMSRSRGSGRGCIRHPEGSEIVPASGTKDHPWIVMAQHGSPAGDLNARSRVGIGGCACSNRTNWGPGRVAGSELLSNAQRLER